MILRRKKNGFGKRPGFIAGALIVSLFLTVFDPRPAKALTCYPGCCFSTVVPAHIQTQTIIIMEHLHQTLEVFGESAGTLTFPEKPEPADGFNRLQHHELWLIDDFFIAYLLPALMMMTEQLTSVMMDQMMIVGAFFDAKQQLETQLLFQELTAQAHRDYHSSFGMCEFGTGSRSLAASEFNSDFTKMVLNKHFMDRQLGVGSSVGAGGPESDRLSDVIQERPTARARLGYFLHNTCDDNDLNKVAGNDDTGLYLCTAEPPENSWVNRDIDWNNTVMSPRTINVDYGTTFAESASDNQRLFEMSNYLYGHEVFSRPDGGLLSRQNNWDDFLNSRAVTAKRSVAQNSFNAIVGLKSRGTRMVDPGNPREFSSEETSDFMRFYMVELGFPLDDPVPYREYMFHKRESLEPPGAADPERDEMSYYAQLEVLSKKLYQRPEFYTELYDKPANVQRKSAAMQAIKLMLDREVFDSQLRAEAITSMILELKVAEEQQNIENKLGLMKERFR